MTKLKMQMDGLTVSTWILLALMAFPMETAAADDVVPGGIYVTDFNLGGLTNEEVGQKVDEYVNSMASQTVTLNVDGTVVNTTAGELGFRWNDMGTVVETAQQYEGGNPIRHCMNLKDLQMNPVTLELEMALDDGTIVSFVETEYNAVTAEAKDANIIRENGAFVIMPEVVGKTVDIDVTKQTLNEALDSGLNVLIVVTAVVEEKLLVVAADQLATIRDVPGTFSMDFSSSGVSCSTSSKVGPGKINGRVLIPGETLSRYECMQSFTTANGYATAAAYENGQVVDSVGGGVCQIATTSYNAALLAELEITQRQNYFVIVSYVKPSSDAAIAGTYKDIKVTNLYGTPIYVEGGTNGRALFFTSYGEETRPFNRTIKYVLETLSVTDLGGLTIKVDLSLVPGVRVQEQFAHRGLESRLWKYVYVDGVETEKIIFHADTYNASKATIRTGPEVPASAESVRVPADVPAESTPSFVTGENGGPGVSASQQGSPPSPGEPGAQHMRKIIRKNHGTMKLGQDLVIVGYIGQEGTGIIVCARKEKLRQWPSKDYVEQIKTNRDVEALIGNLEQWREFGATECESIGEGGVHIALWNLLGVCKAGIESQPLQIPTKQETVEVCERYNVDSYRLYSENCMLLVANNGGHLVRALEEEGIPAVTIGRVNPGIKREILHGRPGTVSPDETEEEGRGYLDRPARDELYKAVPDCLLYKK